MNSAEQKIIRGEPIRSCVVAIFFCHFGAEWFLPILERLRDGELVPDEEIEVLANQHR